MLYKRLKSFLRGIRESRDHRTTKYKEVARNDAYASGRGFALWMMGKA